MIEVKQIHVPEYNSDGALIAIRKMIVKWICPTCGEKMGEPSKISLVKDNSVYTVDLWANSCGHIPKKSELLQFKKKFTSSSAQKVGEKV